MATRVYLPGGRERTKLFPTRRQAVAWETVERSRPVPTTETLRHYVDRVGDSLLASLAPSTRQTYRAHLTHRILPDLGHRRLTVITPAHIEAAQQRWIREGLSSSIVTGTLNCLSRVFASAIRARQLQANPVREVERPRPDPARTTPTLTLAEVDQIAAACDQVQPVYGNLVRLAAGTGLRFGELVALQVGDVDLTAGLITVRRAVSAEQMQTTKSGRIRQVPITGDLHPLLQRLTNGRQASGLVLIGPLGGRIHKGNFYNRTRWVDLVTRLGHPGFRFHDLRATAIVIWIRAQVPLSTVRMIAGHASLATTDRYARIARNDFTGAAQQIDSYIFRTREGGSGQDRQPENRL